jgi:hypothetical protein
MIRRTIRKWWHYHMPREFYFCYMLGSGPPKVKHATREKARAEAARLGAVYGMPVYVMRSIEVVLPMQPSPHPGIDVYGYEEGHMVDCFND